MSARASKRPRVTNPARPADTYHASGERIIEFFDDAAQAGGLMSLQRLPGNDGRATLRVALYRLDDDVSVSVDRLDVRGLMDVLQAHADRLRETADELQAGSIHPVHAANRVRKIANELASAKPNNKKG